MDIISNLSTPKDGTLAEAILSAYEAVLKYGYNIEVVYINNLNLSYPMCKTSDKLNNPFNWTSVSTYHATKEEITKYLENARNDTHRDLIQNWIPVFSEDEAIEKYMENGEVTDGLFRGMGRSFQVRKVDYINWLKMKGDMERVELWESEKQFFNFNLWTAKKSIDYRHTIDKMIFATKIIDSNTFDPLAKEKLDQSIINAIKTYHSHEQI